MRTTAGNRTQAAFAPVDMRLWRLVLFAVVVACSGTSDASTTGVSESVPMKDPDRLVAELTEAGVVTRPVDTFRTEPVGGTGTLICVGAEVVAVYMFVDEAAASAVAARIDPVDPSNLGNASVAWAGRPRFWQRGPMLVLYLDEDVATEALLTELFGLPFAQGAGPGRGMKDPPPACVEG